MRAQFQRVRYNGDTRVLEYDLEITNNHEGIGSVNLSRVLLNFGPNLKIQSEGDLGDTGEPVSVDPGPNLIHVKHTGINLSEGSGKKKNKLCFQIDYRNSQGETITETLKYNWNFGADKHTVILSQPQVPSNWNFVFAVLFAVAIGVVLEWWSINAVKHAYPGTPLLATYALSAGAMLAIPIIFFLTQLNFSNWREELNSILAIKKWVRDAKFNDYSRYNYLSSGVTRTLYLMAFILVTLAAVAFWPIEINYDEQMSLGYQDQYELAAVYTDKDERKRTYLRDDDRLFVMPWVRNTHTGVSLVIKPKDTITTEQLALVDLDPERNVFSNDLRRDGVRAIADFYIDVPKEILDDEDLWHYYGITQPGNNMKPEYVRSEFINLVARIITIPGDYRAILLNPGESDARIAVVMKDPLSAEGIIEIVENTSPDNGGSLFPLEELTIFKELNSYDIQTPEYCKALRFELEKLEIISADYLDATHTHRRNELRNNMSKTMGDFIYLIEYAKYRHKVFKDIGSDRITRFHEELQACVDSIFVGEYHFNYAADKEVPPRKTKELLKIVYHDIPQMLEVCYSNVHYTEKASEYVDRAIHSFPDIMNDNYINSYLADYDADEATFFTSAIVDQLCKRFGHSLGEESGCGGEPEEEPEPETEELLGVVEGDDVL